MIKLGYGMFETQLLPSIVNFELKWFCFVDDVFAVVSDFLNIDEFLDSLNDLHHSIKFKVESETENGLSLFYIH